MSTCRRFLPLFVLAAMTGCGGSELELGEVEGVVTLDDKPLPNAILTFVPKAGGPSSVGKTNENGQYQLMTAGRPGAVLGEHSVSIIVVPELESAPADPNAGHGDGSGIDTSSANYKPPPVPRIPPQYNSKTQLSEQVQPGSNTIDFDLKS